MVSMLNKQRSSSITSLMSMVGNADWLTATVERRGVKRMRSKPIRDAGSNPAWSTIFLSVAQWIEHQPSKLRVIGSNPIGEATFSLWLNRLEHQSYKLKVIGSSPIRETKESLSGGIGRHKGLKIPRLKNHDGSNPSSGTILKLTGSDAIKTFFSAPRTFQALSRQYFYMCLVKIIEKK